MKSASRALIPSGRRGQAMIEALAVFPLLIAMTSLMFCSLILAIAVFLFEHRLEEALLCFSYRPKNTCLAEFDSFTRATALKRLSPQMTLHRQGSLLVGRLQFQRPWGGRFEVTRELKTPLSEARR